MRKQLELCEAGYEKEVIFDSIKIRKTIEEFAVITVGTIIVVIAVFFFMLPSHAAVGSGTGLAMVISNFVPFPVSAITLIMDVGLLITGYILIGPEFGVKTVYCSILMPMVMGILERKFQISEWVSGIFGTLEGTRYAFYPRSTRG